MNSSPQKDSNQKNESENKREYLYLDEIETIVENVIERIIQRKIGNVVKKIDETLEQVTKIFKKLHPAKKIALLSFLGMLALGVIQNIASSFVLTTFNRIQQPLPWRTPNAQPSLIPEIGDIYHFGGYYWRVLNIRNNRAFLLSEYVIGHRGYHTSHIPITWEQSEIRQFLNGDFLDIFGDSDRNRILETRTINNNNPWHGINGGRNTYDYIFILSLEELVYYFGDSGQLRNPRVDQWWMIGADGFINNRVAITVEGANSTWWLRSPGYSVDNAAYVGTWGYVSVAGHWVTSNNGIRPALWLCLLS